MVTILPLVVKNNKLINSIFEFFLSFALIVRCPRFNLGVFVSIGGYKEKNAHVVCYNVLQYTIKSF